MFSFFSIVRHLLLHVTARVRHSCLVGFRRPPSRLARSVREGATWRVGETVAGCEYETPDKHDRYMNGFESALALLAGLLHLVTGPTGYGIAVWVLAIIFLWSGVVKLRRPTLAAMAITDFGVLRRVRPRLGGTLGGAEVLLALLLVTGTLPVLFLPVTAGLLWLFVLLIARSLWSGDRFACFCFGDADSQLSRLTLVRTAALAALASLLAVSPLRTGSYAGFDQTYLLQAIVASAIVGTVVLGGQIAKSLRWNKGPYTVGNMEVNE